MSYILAGDDTGLVKRVKLRDSSVVKFGQQIAGRSIHTLAWAGVASADSEWEAREKEVAVGLKSGVVEIWNAQTRELTAQFDALSMTASMQSTVAVATAAIHPSFRAPLTMNAGSKLVGMAILQANSVGSVQHERRLLTCSNTGLVHIRPFSTLSEDGSTKMEDIPAPTQPKKGGKKSPSLKPAASPNMPNAGATSFAVGSDICVLKVEPSSQQSFACGGKEHMLKIWDLSTATQSFKEKNVPHDMLNLRQEVWITDLAWVPGSGGHELVTGTAWHQVRHYDTRVQKRPLFNVEVGDHAVTCVDVSHDGKYLIVGDGGGRLQQLDLRKNARMVHVYHGMGGSVRSVQNHASLPMLGTCGLDRFLRVYDVKTRKQLHKVYLKQKLNCVLFSAQTPDEEKEREEAAALEEAQVKEEQEDDDELWSELRKRALRQKAAAEEGTEPAGNGSGKYVKKRKQEDDEEGGEAEESEEAQATEEPKSKKAKTAQVKQEPTESSSSFSAASSSAPSAVSKKKKSALFAKVTSSAAAAAQKKPIEVEEQEEQEDGDAMEDVEDGAQEDDDEAAEEAADDVPEVPATPARKGRASTQKAAAATPASATRATRASTRTSTRSAKKA